MNDDTVTMLAVVLTAATIVGAIGVAIMYTRERGRTGPWYIWILAAGHSCYAGGLVVGLLTSPNVSPRIWLYFLGALITLAGLSVMAYRGPAAAAAVPLSVAPALTKLAVFPERPVVEIFVAWLCISGGASLLLNGAPVDAPEAGLPDTVVLVWSLVLVLGGTMILLGVAWPDRVTGILLERNALWPLAFVTAAIGIAEIGVHEPGNFVLLVFFSSVCLMRIRQIHNRIQLLQDFSASP